MTIAILDEKGATVAPDLGKGDLLGVYTFSNDNFSYALFVGMKGSDLELKFFEINAALPPKEELNHFLNLLNPTTFLFEDFNPYELVFYSELGMGRFWSENETIQVSFLEKEGPDGGPLVLQKL